MPDFSALDPFENKQVLWVILTLVAIFLMFNVPYFGFFLALTGLTWVIYKNVYSEEPAQERGFLGNQEEDLFSVLALAAYLSKADRKISREEYDYVRVSLSQSFPPNKAYTYFQVFEKFLHERISLSKVARKINQNLTPNSKIQLLHFLIGLVTIDRVLSPEEEQKLFAIAKSIRIPHASVRSLLALFQFQRIRSGNNQQKRTHYQTRNKANLNNAYAIFRLNQSASEDDIKKRYRELAKKHHPDRVASLGPAFQEKAKEKFQLIQEAYELIKQHKGIH
jgi:DnaJ like chaperone protein